MTDAQLLTEAQEIKNETNPNANTHTRVGIMLENLVNNKVNIADLPYKEYCAIFQQTSSGNPIFTVLQLGVGNINWVRAGTGRYQGTLASAFPNILTPQIEGQLGVDFVSGIPLGYYAGQRVSNDIYEIRTYDTHGDLADSLLKNKELRIRVYAAVVI